MILVNSAAIRAHIEELESVRRNLDRLDSFVTSLKNKAASKAARFDAVQLCGAWTGAAAREFEDELRRTRQQVDRASDGAAGSDPVMRATSDARPSIASCHSTSTPGPSTTARSAAALTDSLPCDEAPSNQLTQRLRISVPSSSATSSPRTASAIPTPPVWTWANPTDRSLRPR